MRYTDYRASFTLKNGRILTCEYTVGYSPGGMWCPPEYEISEPEYKIDGKIVIYDDLPKGLHTIADCMVECPHAEFSRSHFHIRDVTLEREYV
jgi:hypothetical protein